MLCASIFLRVVRMVARDKLGSFQNADDLTSYFERWLDFYCFADPESTIPALRARRPLLHASVRLSQAADSREIVLQLSVRPHYQFDPLPQNDVDFELTLLPVGNE